MADDLVPDADVEEQRRSVRPAGGEDAPALGVDDPEADAIEQEQPVAPPVTQAAPSRGLEVPEADAIEQALPGPLDDEDDLPRR